MPHAREVELNFFRDVVIFCVNRQDFNVNTPLHYLGMAESFQLEKVKLFFEKGADIDVNIKNNEGKFAFEDILNLSEKEKSRNAKKLNEEIED